MALRRFASTAVEAPFVCLGRSSLRRPLRPRDARILTDRLVPFLRCSKSTVNLFSALPRWRRSKGSEEGAAAGLRADVPDRLVSALLLSGMKKADLACLSIERFVKNIS